MNRRFCTVVLLTFVIVTGRGARGEYRLPDDLFDQAKTLSTQEQWEKAITRFREFLGQKPNDPRTTEARFWIGFCLVKSENFDEAIAELAPFESTLAQDQWADDALLQLGHAYRGNDESTAALGVWKALVDKHPDSPGRTEATLQIIEILFGDKDYAGCLSYCDRVVQGIADVGQITEARYAGAYCLNALGRYDESERWMDRWFQPDDAIETGWRRVLKGQHELRTGHLNDAFTTIDSLSTDFADLAQDSRFDLTLRAATMLTRENQATRARELLLATLKQSTGQSEDSVNALLDQLQETAQSNDSFAAILESLALDKSLPLVARVIVRDRRVQILREGEHAEQAESLLRSALTKETDEFARFHAATRLAELLNEDKDDPNAASELLKSASQNLRRNDLGHRIREMIKELEP